MRRRTFLSLVAAAPVLAALKPWQPSLVQEWHVWLVPREAIAVDDGMARFNIATRKPVSAQVGVFNTLPAEGVRIEEVAVAFLGGPVPVTYVGKATIPIGAGDSVSVAIDLPERRATFLVSTPRSRAAPAAG